MAGVSSWAQRLRARMPELYVSGLPEWDGTSSLLQAWGHKTFGEGWRRAYQVPGKKYGFITVDDERMAAEVVQRRCSWFQHGDIDCFITAEPSMGASARHLSSAARSQRHAVERNYSIDVRQYQQTPTFRSWVIIFRVRYNHVGSQCEP